MSIENKIVYRVLLIEDSSADIRLTKEALIESESSVVLDVVMDEKEAQNYLYRCSSKTCSYTKPDLVLLDLNLPGSDGKQILDFIKQNDFLKDIPVIVLTTSSNISDIQYCYENKANCYVTKPVDYDSFVVAIKGICNYWLK